MQSSVNLRAYFTQPLVPKLFVCYRIAVLQFQATHTDLISSKKNYWYKLFFKNEERFPRNPPTDSTTY